MNIIQQIEAESIAALAKDIPDFRPGDTLRVGVKVKEGDRIVFGKYSGTEIKVDGEERLILREDDILGVID